MIYHFNSKKKVTINQIGGKALALVESMNAGFPVPEGMVLAVEFFEPWLTQIKNLDVFLRAVQEPSQMNCDKVKAVAEGLKFNEGQSKLLDGELRKLSGTLFAVRSSSPEEDLDGISFAGMYETLLGQGKKHLQEAIAKTFASCFDYRVMSYKKEHGINLNNTAIAVIVQKQIASEISGVGFSLNPLNNAFDEVMINASFGLGESVVSGRVTPDTYVYDVVQKSIVDKRINSKDLGLWLAPDGGIVQRENEDKNQQALNDTQIIELASLIKACEAYYSKPIDTEWAVEKGVLYLLQARPITTYFPLFDELLTEQGSAKRFYIDMLTMTQGVSEPMSVLGMDIWSKLIYITKSGLLSTEINGTAPVINGKEYLSVTAYLKVLGKTGGKKALGTYDGNIKKIFSGVDIDAHTFVGKPDGTEGYVKRSLGKAFAMLPELGAALFGDVEKIVRNYHSYASDYDEILVGLKSKDSFEVSVDCAMNSFEVFMGKLAPIFVGMMAQKSLEKMFKDEAVETEIAALNMELDGNPTSEMGRLLFDMASSEVFKSIESRDVFISQGNKKNFPKDFQGYVNLFMDAYAFRGIREIDVATRRVYEDMGLLYDLIKQINTEDNQHLYVKIRRQKAYDKLLAHAKSMGKEKAFVKMASRLKATFGYREYPKYMLVKGISKLHEICLELGRMWVEQGRLMEPYEVFDLKIHEIALAQQNETLDLMALREQNLVGYNRMANVEQWPLVIDSRGKIYRPEITESDGGIVGDAIAPGKTTGRVKVMRSPYEKTIEAGEILVTRATEPSWTPIFTNAAAVVMEIGGPLQHGGIIAREYGIPCVSGLVGITDMLVDGDLIEVDGSNGYIRILDQ